MKTFNNIHKGWRTREQKEGLILQWQQSGMSRKEFCHEHQISYNSLVSWCKQLKDKNILHGFTEVKVNTVSDSGLFAQVHLPKGIRIDLFHFVPAEYFQSMIK